MDISGELAGEMGEGSAGGTEEGTQLFSGGLGKAGMLGMVSFAQMSDRSCKGRRKVGEER